MRHLIISLSVVLSVMLMGCTGKQDADLAAGKSIAEANCSGCHGQDGRGVTADIPNLAAQVKSYLVESLNAYRNGQRSHAGSQGMTAKMSEADINNVTSYFSSLPPLSMSDTKINQPPHEKGKATASVCGSCHGEDGNSSTPGIPTLAGQQPLYFISAVQSYQNGSRTISTAEKGAMLAALDKVDVESMALYFALQTPTQRETPSVGDPVAGEQQSISCGGCHGDRGVSSDITIPRLAGQDSQYLRHLITLYRNRAQQHDDMHRFLTDSSDADIENMAAFYSIQKSTPAEQEPISVAQLVEKCEHCHGATVENATVAFPKISGQSEAYLAKTMKAYRDGQRPSSMMHKMSSPYGDVVIEGVASWYANQPAR